ncbi:MAG TPA: hypothetical protein VH228_12325 [Nocardioides sp.]|nr:hypothetical protein [Nocardioides sp.]
MKTASAWAAYTTFGLCFLAAVTWPLWTDSLLWHSVLSVIMLALVWPIRKLRASSASRRRAVVSE